VLISFAYLARNEYEIIRWPEMVVNKSGTRARSRRITAGENQVVLFNKGANHEKSSRVPINVLSQ
jgi:hypothetical protein